MARRSLRRVRYNSRNPRPVEAPRALTAAMQPIPDPTALSKQFKNPIGMAAANGWQSEAWACMDTVGELRYYVSWRAMSCSRVRFIASELDERGKPTGECADQEVNDIAAAIGGGALGAARFIHRSIEQLTVPGETIHAVIHPRDKKGNETEEWLALSRDEIRKTTTGNKPTTTITRPNGEEYLFRPDDDSMWRCWSPHPRVAKDADSPVRAALPALREVRTTTATIEGVGKSRLLGAGVVFVPTEMSLPAANAPTAADQPGQPGSGAQYEGAAAVTMLEELLWQVAAHSYENDDAFTRMIPIFASVAGEQIKNIQHLKFDEAFTKEAIATRNDAIARLALALDVSPERLLGIGSSSNHWSAWQIGDNDVAIHIAPIMELICEALTRGIFRQALIDIGRDPDDYVVWYDASELTADPDKSDDATDAFDRGVITAEAFRKFLNLGDTGYDLVSGDMEEWRKWAIDALAQDPSRITALQPLIPELEGLEFPVVEAIERKSESAGQSDTTNEGDSPDTEDADPGYDQGKRGRKEDVGSRVVQSEPFVRIFTTRALDLAGKRRRTREWTATGRLRGYKPHEYHGLMGPVEEGAIDALVAGWDDTLEDSVLRMIGTNRQAFSDAVLTVVRRELTEARDTAKN